MDSENICDLNREPAHRLCVLPHPGGPQPDSCRMGLAKSKIMSSFPRGGELVIEKSNIEYVWKSK